MKTCSKCKSEKELSAFYFRKDTGKRRKECKVCFCAARVRRQGADLAKQKWQKVKDDPEKLEAARETNRKASRRYRENHPNRRKKSCRKWRETNQDHQREYGNRYTRKKYKENPAFRLIRKTRERMRKALKGISKSGSTIRLVGCTAEQLRRHIERQFAEGMTWENTHCDHILPLAAFDMSSKKQQRYAFHWSNCQPLFVEDNLRKSDKYCPDELEAYLKSDLPEAI